jgi:hypothetical protein
MEEDFGVATLYSKVKVSADETYASLRLRLEDRGRRTNQNPHIEVMLQYYRKYVGRDKFKYDHTDSKWIDIDCVICNVTLAYNPQNEVYSLDRNDAEHLRQLLADHSAR